MLKKAKGLLPPSFQFSLAPFSIKMRNFESEIENEKDFTKNCFFL